MIPWNGVVNIGLSLLVSLGPADDRARFGVGLDAEMQRLAHEGPFWGSGERRPGLAVGGTAHVMWVHPYVTAELTGRVGVIHPLEVADAGFVPLAGVQSLIGVAMSTDGSAGPVIGAGVPLPFSALRFEATRYRGAWHAPRIAGGVMAPMGLAYLD